MHMGNSGQANLNPIYLSTSDQLPSRFVDPTRVIRFPIQLALDKVVAEAATLKIYVRNTPIRRIYVLALHPVLLKRAEIISKLRGISEPQTAGFYVVSCRPGRTLICIWSSSDTTKAPSIGLESSSRSLSSSSPKTP